MTEINYGISLDVWGNVVPVIENIITQRRLDFSELLKWGRCHPTLPPDLLYGYRVNLA